MGFFERPDHRLLQSADPTPLAAIAAALRRDAAALTICALALAAAYAANVSAGLRSAATTDGTLSIHGVLRDVTIVRDRRDVPHVIAANAHDLYFAEGFAQGSDRLFQLDLTRRYAYGRLAEVLGAKALPMDKAQRAVDVAGIAGRQLRALAPGDAAALSAFSDGVNAAASTQPLPLEFRMLLYRPAPWSAKDSLAVSIVASLELADSWHDVFARDAAWRRLGSRCYAARFPLSDSRYDVAVDGTRDARSERPSPSGCDDFVAAIHPQRRTIGSNAWAAGAARSAGARALIANDPHLDLTIPGIWYLVDLRAPGVHVAGATIPGIPGVVLGHNDRVAWATTNAEMTTSSVFAAGRLTGGSWATERFGVRFARDATATYYRTPCEFSVPNDNDRSSVALVRWPVYAQARSTITTILALDRARDVREALQTLARYRGSPENFILADRSGVVAYHVAGLVPNDPAWGRYVHSARDRRTTFAPVPFAELPGRPASRDAVLISANNRAYGASYSYRLSAQFEPPYRAYRIAQLLRQGRRYDVGYFARMQLDTLSPLDLEIARDAVRFAHAHPAGEIASNEVALLQRWDGRYEADSRAAAIEHSLRLALFEQPPAMSEGLEDLRAGVVDPDRDVGESFDGAIPLAFRERRDWGEAGATRIEHPLAPMNFAFLNGGWLPGAGDEYTIRLQEPGFAQGFRAVWDVGDWDAGGISIPSGESGELGSRHYTDLTRDWVAGVLEPLPFSAAAVKRDATGALVLKAR